MENWCLDEIHNTVDEFPPQPVDSLCKLIVRPNTIRLVFVHKEPVLRAAAVLCENNYTQLREG